MNGMRFAETEQVMSDSDWEYEYDENETEDFYFTLDRPPTVEPASKRRKANGKKGAVNEASDPQYITNGKTSQPAGDQKQNHEPLRFDALHTTTPSVQFGGQHYDCRWTTDLGTQFHVSRPGVVKHPHRAGHAVDVVALSRVRLTGRHATTPRMTESANGNAAEDAIVLDGDEDDGYASEEASTQAAKQADGPPEASFLERIAEIQRRKAANGAVGSNAWPERQPYEPLQGASKPSSNDPSAMTVAPGSGGAEPADTSNHPSQHAQPSSEAGTPLTNGQQSSRNAESEQRQDGRVGSGETTASAEDVT